MPLADVVTPNLHEAAKLTGLSIAGNEDAMLSQAEILLKSGAKSVLVKGGHGMGNESSDLLVTQSGNTWFRSPRIDTRNTHGTGCSLSSAVAANLAQGDSLETAVDKAKQWLNGAIAAADQLDIGTGSGPVHHFHNLWRT